jgi:hypothetical protein
MSDVNDRYKKAAKLRLMTAMSGGPTQPAPGVPNYSAIPLEPPQQSGGWLDGVRKRFQGAMAVPSQDLAVMAANGLSNLGPRGANAAQAPGARPAPSVEPSPAFPQAAGWTGEGDTRLPSAPPIQGPMGVQERQQFMDANMIPPAPPPQMPAAPQGANAAFQPPPGWMPPADYMRTQGDADLGGYGGNPGMGAPIPAPPQYSHLNPTPGLEEIFRREYAANPGAFGKIG